MPLATLFESPCVHSTAPPDLTQNLAVEGTGNPGACTSAIRDLFNFSSCTGRQDCAFDGVYQPPVQGQFYVSTPLWLPGPWGCAQGRRDGRAQDRGLLGAATRGAGERPRLTTRRAPGLLQLLPHLPLPEPHLRAAAGRCQRHCLGILPAVLEAGGWTPGPPPRRLPGL